MNHQNIQNLLREINDQLGFDHCTLLVKKSHRMNFETTYPHTWINRYVSEDYHNSDYVLLKKNRSYKPIIWGHSLLKKCSPIQKKIFLEAADFGIASGVTIPFQTAPETMNAVTFVTKDSETIVRSTFQEQMHSILFASQVLCLALPHFDSSQITSGDDILMMRKFIQYYQRQNRLRIKKHRTLEIIMRTAQSEVDNYGHSLLKEKTALLFDIAQHKLKHLS